MRDFHKKLSRFRPLIAFSAVLFFVVLAADALWLSKEHDFLKAQQISHMKHDLDIMGHVLEDALLRGDYSSTQAIVSNWAESRDEVVSLRTIAPNGFVLSNFNKPAPEGNNLRMKRTISSGGRELVTIELEEHSYLLDAGWNKLVRTHVLTAMAFACVLTTLLWMTLRKTAFIPMESMIGEISHLNETLEERVGRRTRELEIINEELQQEISHRRRAEANLEDILAVLELEQEKTKSILAAMGDGVSIQDKNFRIVYQNDIHRTLIGDQLGRFCYEAYEQSDEVCPGCPVALSFKDGKTHTVERSSARDDGSIASVEITASCLKGPDGEVAAGIEIVRDVSVRKRAEEMMRFIVEGTSAATGEDFFRLLVKNLAVALHYRYAVIGQLSGEDSDLVTTLSFWKGHDYGENITYNLAGTPCQQVFGSGEPCRYPSGVKELFPDDVYLVHMNAESYMGLPLKNSHGRMIGLIAVIDDRPREEDPTELDILRIFAARAGSELERKNIEEEKESLRFQLIQSQKMESVGRLAGGIAHDFNNLLSTIIGYSELLILRISDSDPLREDLQSIMDAGQKAASLTRQLLAFSRKQVLEMQIVEPNRIIEDLGKMLGRMIGGNIELILDLGDNVGPVMADKAQMEQVLMNLAVNSRDAMPKGGSFTIKTSIVELGEGAALSRGLSPGPYVLISATDTGHGIDKENLEKIFEPFFTTKEVGEGTGLGLATVYGIIRQHKGHIEAKNEPGGGSSFNIYLPPSEGEAGEQYAVEETRLPRGRETVLVVDDDVSVLRLISDTLTMLGYQVIAAASPAEAIQKLGETDKVDVLLTDLIMPGNSGIELAREVKTISPETRVIFATGYVDRPPVHEDSLGRAAGFLIKPLSPRAIAGAVREILDSQ